MKTIRSSLLILCAACLLVFFAGIACAAPAKTLPLATGETSSREAAFRVLDDAALLSPSEYSQLENRAAAISEAYQCGVAIATVWDYTTIDARSVKAAAQQLYREYRLGYGDGQDGVLLFLSMQERDYALITYGEGSYLINDTGLDYLEPRFLDDFRNDDWYGGFSDYLTGCEHLFREAERGSPFGADTGFGFDALTILTIALGSLGISGLICFGMRYSMRSVAKAVSASSYAAPGGVNLQISEDTFTHVTQTRTRIAEPSSNTRGGHSGGLSAGRAGRSSGGKHHSGGGFSGRSGKF